MNTPVTLPADELFKEIEAGLMAVKNDQSGLYRAIVQVPFDHERAMALLFLGFISLFVVDEVNQVVVPGAFTENEYYQHSVADYDFDPTTYKLPLTSTENGVVKAITTGQAVSSDNWDSFRRPNIDEGVARLNQAAGGIGYSMVYPVTGKIKGALIFNYYQFPEAIGEAQKMFMDRYSKLVSKVLA